ncbi:hypothetical protein KEM55_006791 [Ascosphaera atra]|nr:hypothetical protein KEM55_006791 [Ascosphaera atra]
MSSYGERHDPHSSDEEDDQYEDTIDHDVQQDDDDVTPGPSSSARSEGSKTLAPYLARASSEAQTVLTQVSEETKAIVAQMYHRRKEKGTREMDRLILDLYNLGHRDHSTNDDPGPSRRRETAPSPASTEGPRRDKGKQPVYDIDSSESDTEQETPPVTQRRTRQLKDIGKPPRYAGEKKDSAAQRWLHKCLDYFQVETLLTGITTTEEQRVILASTWLDGAARHAWDFLREASHADPVTSPLPKTWKAFSDWLLLHFDELNATERRRTEFFAMKQRGKDIQDYYNSYNIAFHLAGMRWSVEDRLRHFLLSLDENLQLEWMRLKDQPETENEILAELIRLQHIIQTQ